MNTQESEFDRLMYESGLSANGCFGDMDSYDQKAVQKFGRLIAERCAIIARTASKDYDAGLEISHEITKIFELE